MFKKYFTLTKPGIIFGNAVTLAGGFFLASHNTPDWSLFFTTLTGVSFVVASGCVLNNYIDHDIDAAMERTKNRSLVLGTVSKTGSLIFAATLGLLGFSTLILYTNLATTIATLIGYVVYVVIYSLWVKRYSYWSTAVGGISGAMPPVAGYLAASNQFDLAALMLFILLSIWQMPHFFSIALYRMEEYRAASVPVFPIVKGVPKTKLHMTLYTGLFFIATVSLYGFGYTGWLYLIIMTPLSALWFLYSIRGFFVEDTKKWAREMFLFSLLIIMVISFAIGVNPTP